MPKEIKTKTIVKDIKVLDKAANGTAHAKNAFIRSKQNAEGTQDPQHNSASEYASDHMTGGAKDISERASGRLYPRKNITENINKAKKQFQKAKRNLPKQRKQAAKQAKKAADNAKQTADALKGKAEQTRKTAERAKKAVTDMKRTLQRTRQAGRQTVQTAKQAGKGVKATGKGTVKTVKKSVKTAERSAKVAVKTAKQTAKATQQSAKAAAKAAKLAAQASKAAAKAAIVTAKAAIKATIVFVKATIAAVKGLIALIAAGGWVAVVIILVICVVALIIGSCFGIFFSNDTEQNQNGFTMTGVIVQINGEFSAEIERIKNENPHDEIEGVTTPQNWKEVLAVYAVKCTTDPDNPTDIATLDESKAEIIRTIFWDMNAISFTVETIEPEPEPEPEPSETASSTPAPTSSVTEPLPPKTILHIIVTGKSHSEIAVQYGFNTEQNKQLSELLKPEYNDMWNALLAGY